MKTAIYARVSTSEQNISMQEREISLYLENKDIKFAQNYYDHGYSGSTENRPEFKSLLSELKAGNIELLIVWKMDRLFRSLSKLLAFMEVIREKKIKFVALKDNIDITTPMGMCYMGIFGAIAEFEREMIKERTKSGIANARAKGVKFGAPIKISQATRDLVIQLRSAGLSYKAIGQQCNISNAMAYKLINSVKVLKQKTDR